MDCGEGVGAEELHGDVSAAIPRAASRSDRSQRGLCDPRYTGCGIRPLFARRSTSRSLHRSNAAGSRFSIKSVNAFVATFAMSAPSDLT